MGLLPGNVNIKSLDNSILFNPHPCASIGDCRHYIILRRAAPCDLLVLAYSQQRVPQPLAQREASGGCAPSNRPDINVINIQVEPILGSAIPVGAACNANHVLEAIQAR